MTKPTEQHKAEARESLFVVIGEIGGVWATFDTREKAERYPGPRMLELAARSIVEYVPASLLASRDREVREVLEGLQTYWTNKGCWCKSPGHPSHAYKHSDACLAARALYNRLQPVREGKDGRNHTTSVK